MASANINDKLIIFKGDDTGGVFGRRLAFTIEASDGVDLSGCRAEWIFDGIVKTFPAPLVNGETREVFYSHNETRCMALGVRYGTFRIIDAAGKVRTLTNTKPVEVTNDAARCYPGASAASFVVHGIGDMKHSEFADLEEKEGMTLNEVGGMVNTLIRKLKGTVSAFASILAFGAFADGAITPQTDFGDIRPTAKIGDVISYAGAVMTESDPTVPAWAKQANPPEGMTDNALVLTNGAVVTKDGQKTIGAADVGAVSKGGDTMTGGLSVPEIGITDGGTIYGASRISADEYTGRDVDSAPAFFPNGLFSPTTAYAGEYVSGSLENPTPAFFPTGIAGINGLVNFFSLGDTTHSDLRPDGTQVATLGLLDSEGYIKSESDPVFTAWLDGSFSNAVLAVGMNIDTNSVAVLNDIAATFGGFPLGAGETATTVGGLLAALAAAIAWLKKNKVGSFASVGGASATVENGVAKLDDFFTGSNSLLTGAIDARLPYPLNAVPSTGLLKDRAINTTSLASVTVPDNFTDLLVRASVASSLSVTMPEAIATKYGDTFPGEAGEYLITITKTGTSEAYVRTIKLEVANA